MPLCFPFLRQQHGHLCRYINCNIDFKVLCTTLVKTTWEYIALKVKEPHF